MAKINKNTNQRYKKSNQNNALACEQALLDCLIDWGLTDKIYIKDTKNYEVGKSQKSHTILVHRESGLEKVTDIKEKAYRNEINTEDIETIAVLALGDLEKKVIKWKKDQNKQKLAEAFEDKEYYVGDYKLVIDQIRDTADSIIIDFKIDSGDDIIPKLEGNNIYRESITFDDFDEISSKSENEIEKIENYIDLLADFGLEGTLSGIKSRVVDLLSRKWTTADIIVDTTVYDIDFKTNDIELTINLNLMITGLSKKISEKLVLYIYLADFDRQDFVKYFDEELAKVIKKYVDLKEDLSPLIKDLIDNADLKKDELIKFDESNVLFLKIDTKTKQVLGLSEKLDLTDLTPNNIDYAFKYTLDNFRQKKADIKPDNTFDILKGIDLKKLKEQGLEIMLNSYYISFKEDLAILNIDLNLKTKNNDVHIVTNKSNYKTYQSSTSKNSDYHSYFNRMLKNWINNFVTYIHNQKGGV